MKYLTRKIDAFLLDWKSNSNHNPLIVKGARQIGKTESILHFANNNYANVIYINFVEEPHYKNIIVDGYKPEQICKNISRLNPDVRFIKGDPYVLDNSKTPGHTNTVTATSWHPTQDNMVLSASLDGTCRIWDLNGKRSFDELQSLQVIRAKNKKGIKVGITSASYNTTGNQIFLGCNEGGLLIYDIRNKYIKGFYS